MYLSTARDFSSKKLESVKKSLSSAEKLFGQRVCVYATGSYGRLEAGPSSDLDLFIVSDMIEKKSENGPKIERRLSGIDEIKLQYHLISCVEENELPAFDGDGKYLSCHTFEEYVKYLGGPDDDAKNSLTGRLLLLLESKPLLGVAEYDRLIGHVIEKYFLDHSANPKKFVPAFLFNDILRMWRTFCVNYEYKRKSGSAETKIKNLKLKYSRMLTCYSALLFLLDAYSRNETVNQNDVRDMISKTPTERLLAVSGNCNYLDEASREIVVSSLSRALSDYSEFLEFMHDDNNSTSIQAVEVHEEWRGKSYQFGEAMELALSSIGRMDGKSSVLYRLVLI
ncbi:nucleotidyltransferase domain-containing protein [Paracoccus marinaquae]|uniref:nucleotidyltransferase domain-containing protein n=1 Tax=Paracoccus marinaquae TaxID=2841926 RepID=UPI0032AFBC16